ncbi:hypothetical protein DVR12_14895 [Chitinophaga silvatica]|uniref:Uncharacterized protein n=1 Tax=Chitinophaga silvatica TaxID=2282649 RepID=A0A3E1Y955_9BACT|nr:hypothetical protein [Chitinophaga silvatica]RFS21935.1 hypothetical protein DVR12_14895 [Chitinophaga silvatica]
MLLQDVLTFLNKNVINRQLQTEELTYSLDESTLEGAYADRMFFSDLTSGESSIQFNLTTVTDERVYLMDDNNVRTDLIKDFTGTSVFRYELAVRRSTGAITGYMRCLSSTVRSHTMEAIAYGVYEVRIENDQLKWREQQLLYRDTPAGDGIFKPIAFDAEVRFYLEDELLRFEYLPFYFDVDVEKMTKILSKDVYPPFVGKEIRIPDKD